LTDRPLTRLLVVEDDPDIANLVSLALGDVGGYVVKSCFSASEALDAVGPFQPDLILLDVMMPGADGVAALKSLRLLPATRETPVVFMTAMAEPDDLVRYDALGCLGVIPKPFDPMKLAGRLEALWGCQAAERRGPCRNELEELRLAYVRELPGRIRAMQGAAAALASGGWDRETVEALYHETHRLAGSSGLYRMAKLSHTAGILEEILKLLLSGPSWPPSSAPSELTTLVKAVARTARTESRPASPASRGN
jgi:two-component system, OmpR family, response regulator